MIDRPKFEDWCHDPSPDTWGSQKEAWDARMSACEPIIAGLEAERNNLELSFQAANELLVDALTELKSARYYRVVAKVKRLKSYDKMRKQLAEQDAALEQVKQDAASQMLDRIRASVRDYPDFGGDIEIMQAVEQRIAEAVLAELRNIEQKGFHADKELDLYIDRRIHELQEANRAKAEGRGRDERQTEV